MRKFQLGLKALAFCGLALAVVSPASAAVTHKSIPLDSGGWFSGLNIHSSGRLYGYGDVFGTFRSDDAGQTWTYMNRNMAARLNEHGNPEDDNFVTGMAVAKGNVDTVAFLAGARLWVSSNGGKDWEASLTDIAHVESLVRGASPIMFHPSDDKDVWLARKRNNLSGSLWRLKDGAWNKVGGDTFVDAEATTIHVHPNYPDQVWVGTQKGLYVSLNRGADWKYVWGAGLINTAPASTNNRSGLPPLVKAVVRNSSGVGYLASDLGGYLITASDWSNTATYTFTKKMSDPGSYGPDNAAVLNDGRFVSGKDLETLISSADGQTWTALAMNLSPDSPRPIWSPPLPAKVDGGRDFIVQDPTNLSRWLMTGGFAPTISLDSGQNWKFVPNGGGIAGVMTTKVNFPLNKPSVAMVPGSDVGVSIVTDGGASGSAAANSNRQIGTLHTYHEVMSNDGQTMFAAGVDQTIDRTAIIKSTDGGMTWEKVLFSDLPDNAEGVTRSVMNPNNANDFLVLLGHSSNKSPNNPGMYRTTNGGLNFRKITSGLPVFGSDYDPGMRYHAHNAFLEADSGSRSSYRYLALRSNFYRSQDNGETWSKVTTTPFQSDWIHSFAVDRAKPGRIWAAGGYRGLKYSDNGGDNWVEVAGFSQAKSMDAASGRVAVFGMRTGDNVYKIYYSPNDGKDWSEASGEGNRYAFTKDLAVDPSVAGKVWVSGISVNVISGLPGSTTTTPTNLITNPSFDADGSYTQTPSGWSEWEGNASGASITPTSSYTEAYGGSNSGTSHGTHYKDAAYQVYTYQTKTGLANGLYTLRAYARRSGNQTTCYLEATGFGSTKKMVNIPASSTYQLVEIKDINVTNGTCTIGFWTVAGAHDFSYFDDVSFFKQ